MNKRMPTVAVFVGHYPPMGGGIARLASTTFLGLGEQGCRVVFVTAKYEESQMDYEEISDTVAVYRLPIFKTFGSKRYPIFKPNRIYRNTMRRLEKSSIDRIIVLTRFHLTSHIGARFGNAHNIPVYMLECSGAPLTLKNKLLDYPLRWVEKLLSYSIFRRVNYFYGMSLAAGKFIYEQYRIRISPSLWSCSVATGDGVVKHVDTERVTITYCGRVENLKGEEQLAKAFMDLAREHNNLYLNFVGTGSYLDVLKKNFQHSNIKYWGKQDIEEINRINNMSDIAVCATTFPDGAVPNSVLEAGSQKCAMVCSPNGGFLEIIEDGVNGLLTDETVSVKSMKESLKKLIEDKALRERLAERLFEDVSARYSTEVVSKRILKDLKFDAQNIL